MPLLSLLPRQPDPFIVKAADQELAKFGHLKRLISLLTDRLGNNDYKVYSVLLTQEGSNAPVASVLNNSLGFTPTWFYGLTGTYYLEGIGRWPRQDKVMIMGLTPHCSSGDVATRPYYNASWIDQDYICLSTSNLSVLAQYSDDMLYYTPFELRIYS